MPHSKFLSQDQNKTQNMKKSVHFWTQVSYGLMTSRNRINQQMSDQSETAETAIKRTASAQLKEIRQPGGGLTLSSLEAESLISSRPGQEGQSILGSCFARGFPPLVLGIPGCHVRPALCWHPRIFSHRSWRECLCRHHSLKLST